jgi:hypothetical protein
VRYKNVFSLAGGYKAMVKAGWTVISQFDKIYFSGLAV